MRDVRAQNVVLNKPDNRFIGIFYHQTKLLLDSFHIFFFGKICGSKWFIRSKNSTRDLHDQFLFSTNIVRKGHYIV